MTVPDPPPPPPTHVPFIEKQPDVRFIPPAFSKVEVASEKLMPDALPETPRESSVPGDDVLMPIFPVVESKISQFTPAVADERAPAEKQSVPVDCGL